MSKFIRPSGEDSTITEWTPPVIGEEADFTVGDKAEISINSDFIDIDFTQQLHDSKPIDKDIIDNRDRGYDDGYKIGKHEAESLLHEETKKSLVYLQSNLAKLDEQLSGSDGNVEKELAELAILIAEKMISDHIRHKPETIVNLVAEAIKLLPSKNTKLALSINPEDLAFIDNNSESLEDFNCKFIEDETLQRGGLLVKSDDTTIDLSLEKRMHDLIQQFFDNNS